MVGVAVGVVAVVGVGVAAVGAVGASAVMARLAGLAASVQVGGEEIPRGCREPCAAVVDASVSVVLVGVAA